MTRELTEEEIQKIKEESAKKPSILGILLGLWIASIIVFGMIALTKFLVKYVVGAL